MLLFGSRKSLLASVFLAIGCAGPCFSADSDALAIDASIQARHLPFGTILDPINASAASSQITGYTRCGDSALWTGHYLAAEAFRYNVTGDAAALSNVKTAIAGIQSLIDITGTDLLARCLVPESSPYAAGIESEEAANGVHTNSAAGGIWIGNTSRDEYSGVMFGLAAAYDMVNDAGVQSAASQLVTRIINFLQGHAWTIVMPDGTVSTTFVIRPDEILSFLAIAQHVNPAAFSASFNTENALLTAEVTIPIAVDAASNGSYFKFNLDYINFFSLLRLESNSSFKAAYSILRAATARHQNAYFDIIDRALNGANQARDDETTALLNQWLQRSTRDFPVNLQNAVPVCGSEACQPVPVPLRPPTDFLWQRDPFQLAGGGSGVIESAGIDYILPWWMARYYGVVPRNRLQSAAAASLTVAPDSIAAMYGTNLASGTGQAATQPLPVTLATTTVTVTDSAGVQRPAPLFYVSPQQINLLVPEGTAPGLATFTSMSAAGVSATATAMVQSVAPTVFSMSGNGIGVPAALAIEVSPIDPAQQIPVPVFSCTTGNCMPAVLSLGTDTPLYLSLFGTGIRNVSSTSDVLVTMNGISLPVIYAGVAPAFAGLDQINVAVPLTLHNAGEANLIITVSGQTANAVRINVQ